VSSILSWCCKDSSEGSESSSGFWLIDSSISEGCSGFGGLQLKLVLSWSSSGSLLRVLMPLFMRAARRRQIKVLFSPFGFSLSFLRRDLIWLGAIISSSWPNPLVILLNSVFEVSKSFTDFLFLGLISSISSVLFVCLRRGF